MDEEYDRVRCWFHGTDLDIQRRRWMAEPLFQEEAQCCLRSYSSPSAHSDDPEWTVGKKKKFHEVVKLSKAKGSTFYIQLMYTRGGQTFDTTDQFQEIIL